MDHSSWYTTAQTKNAQLLQGELIFSCPLVLPVNNYDQFSDSDDVPADVYDYDVIVMSQSCDLDTKHCSPEFVIVCPFDTPPAYFFRYNKMFKHEYLDALRTNRAYEFFLLDKCQSSEDKPADYLIVDFRAVHTVPYGVAWRTAQKGPRIQLKSPYIEYLSHAFARFFSRVAVPDEGTIAEFHERWKELKPTWAKAVEELKKDKTAEALKNTQDT